jgi:presenilin-like A22 family membrane protease
MKAYGQSIDGIKTVIIPKVPENYDYLAVYRSHKGNSIILLISDIKKPMLNIYKIRKNNRITYASI